MSGKGQMRQDRASDGVAVASGPIVAPGANAALAPVGELRSSDAGVGGNSVQTVVRNSDSVVSEGVSHSLTHYQSPEGVGTVLLALGVFSLSSPRRTELATEIEAASITGQQLRDLESYIHEGEPDAGKARRFLTAIVCDLAKLRDAVEGLAKFRALNSRPAKDNGPAHMVNIPVGSACCPCNACVAKRGKTAAEPWDHDWQCRVAYCLHNSDRRTVAELAAFLAVSESTAKLMVERGRVLSQSTYVEGIKAPRDWKRIERDEKGGAERLREFREATRSGRLRMMQGEA